MSINFMSINVVLPHCLYQNVYAPMSLRMQRHCIGRASIEPPKFIAASSWKHGFGMLSGTTNLDGKTHNICDYARSSRSSYHNHRLAALTKSVVSVVRAAKKVFTYRFRTETGEQLKVIVEKKDDKYRVHVELLSSQFSGTKSGLVMSWGVFRSDSSCFMPLDFQKSGLNGKCDSIETPFVQISLGSLAVELEYESSFAPFYISFLLKSQFDAKVSEIRSHREKNFVVPVGFGSGKPAPLGLSFLADGSMNFALFSRGAERVVLCLYDENRNEKPALEIDLDPYVNKSGDIWHVSLQSNSSFLKYGYRCKVATDKNIGHVVLDPYAKVIQDFESSSVLKGLGQLCKDPPIDWGHDRPPCLPLEELIVYRLNVMRFTKDKSSKLSNQIAGTFSGISEKLNHFKDLGVNAVLLEPIFPCDEQKGPYFPWHFFSPGIQSGSSSDTVSVINSIKEMVKKLHSSGIEVFLEVVFTQTAECAALKEIDNSSYYYNNIKTGDALNCNYHIVTQMILDSLRHWVIDFHIDGFCFVDSSSLTRGFHGESLSRPPLVEMIAFDPILSKVKVIADSWDPNKSESKDILFPHWKRWAEMNSRFCYDVRKFLNGQGLLSELATRLCGSGDVFLDGRGPSFSFNFVARNSGLSLVDLVSFSNSSKLVTELSWNCGEEGPTNKATVLEKRLKQIRNFLFILFVSQGVPVLNMGDECGQSCGGSPAYHDRKPMDWNALNTVFGTQTTQFISFLSSLRARRRDLFQKNFLKEESIQWYGKNLCPPRWDDVSSKFLAMVLKSSSSSISSNSGGDDSCLYGDLFIVFNGANLKENLALPPAPVDMEWFRLVDTACPFPGFFSSVGTTVENGAGVYEMMSHSCALFEARSLVKS